MGERGVTVWFTGLSGAGKTTIAERLQQVLRERGHNAEITHCDVARPHLSQGWRFRREDLRFGWPRHRGSLDSNSEYDSAEED